MSTEVALATIADAIEAYIEAGRPMEVPHIEIATWIINQGLFDISFESKLKLCDRQVADALRTAERTDPQGRKVRRFLAYRGPWIDEETGQPRQKWLWKDAFEANATQAHAGARAMHKAIGQDCKRLYDFIYSMNENNPNLRDNPIQLSWDFGEYITE